MIVETTLLNGGGTFGENVPETGYFVAREEPYLTIPLSEFNNESISRFPVPDGCFLGTWVHEDNVYIDVTEHFVDLDKALEAARLGNQLAIWDIEKEEEIFL